MHTLHNRFRFSAGALLFIAIAGGIGGLVGQRSAQQITCIMDGRLRRYTTRAAVISDARERVNALKRKFAKGGSGDDAMNALAALQHFFAFAADETELKRMLGPSSSDADLFKWPAGKFAWRYVLGENNANMIRLAVEVPWPNPETRVRIFAAGIFDGMQNDRDSTVRFPNPMFKGDSDLEYKVAAGIGIGLVSAVVLLLIGRIIRRTRTRTQPSA